jgi:hypothetical protein
MLVVAQHSTQTEELIRFLRMFFGCRTQIYCHMHRNYIVSRIVRVRELWDCQKPVRCLWLEKVENSQVACTGQERRYKAQQSYIEHIHSLGLLCTAPLFQ